MKILNIISGILVSMWLTITIQAMDKEDKITIIRGITFQNANITQNMLNLRIKIHKNNKSILKVNLSDNFYLSERTLSAEFHPHFWVYPNSEIIKGTISKIANHNVLRFVDKNALLELKGTVRNYSSDQNYKIICNFPLSKLLISAQQHHGVVRLAYDQEFKVFVSNQWISLNDPEEEIDVKDEQKPH